VQVFAAIFASSCKFLYAEYGCYFILCKKLAQENKNLHKKAYQMCKFLIQVDLKFLSKCRVYPWKVKRVVYIYETAEVELPVIWTMCVYLRTSKSGSRWPSRVLGSRLPTWRLVELDKVE